MLPSRPHAHKSYLQELNQDTNGGIRKLISRWNGASKRTHSGNTKKQ
jgi:uncharacterized protein YukE